MKIHNFLSLASLTLFFATAVSYEVYAVCPSAKYFEDSLRKALGSISVKENGIENAEGSVMGIQVNGPLKFVEQMYKGFSSGKFIYTCKYKDSLGNELSLDVEMRIGVTYPLAETGEVEKPVTHEPGIQTPEVVKPVTYEPEPGIQTSDEQRWEKLKANIPAGLKDFVELGAKYLPDTYTYVGLAPKDISSYVSAMKILYGAEFNHEALPEYWLKEAEQSLEKLKNTNPTYNTSPVEKVKEIMNSLNISFDDLDKNPGLAEDLNEYAMLTGEYPKDVLGHIAFENKIRTNWEQFGAQGKLGSYMRAGTWRRRW